MKSLIFYILVFISGSLVAQESSSEITLSEYLSYVKKYHPIVKQANLVLNESEAKLLKSRGAFDPKLEVDYNRKTFKSKEYFDKLNATFKIPTWYGIEFKASFEENEGLFLNPEANVPNEGLYSAGVSIPVARGLLINSRMAVLKQSKLFLKQAKADRQLLINNILYEATLTYFKWLQSYNEKQAYKEFLTNADIRFNGIKKSFEAGEVPAIDTLEAKIALNNRKLNLEKARIKLIKSALELSNYLWLNEDTPIEIKDNIIPDTNTLETIGNTLNVSDVIIDYGDLNNHPKLKSLNYKLKGLNIEKRLKYNNLLPKIDLQYNFLSQTPELLRSFSTSAYKSGVNISFPLFLRKERGDLKLTKLKVQDVQFELKTTEIALKNKIEAIKQEILSLQQQNKLTSEIVEDYKTMLRAEERKLFLGESSLFLINSRESKLIDSKLKAITLENNLLNTTASFFNILALSDDPIVNEKRTN